MFLRLFAMFALFLVALFGAAQPLNAQERITVFAAASLKNALDDTNTAFTKATGVKVVSSYEASSALARQIAHTMPRKGECERTWLALQARARGILEELTGDERSGSK